MKNFFKKLSLVMALALVLTSLAPAASANAASKMAMNKKSVVLYLTENAKDTPDNYDFSIKNKPEDWKTTLDFKWESSNEDVATVGKAGLTQAVGVGVATISCTVTEKATGEEVAVVTAKVDVRANADKIVINNAPENGKVGIGEAVIDLNRTLYVDGVATTKRGVVCTNYTRWTSSDETVATVDKNGVVTTLKAGEVTITAEAYQSEANDETIVSDSVKLVAEASLVGAKQVSATKATVTFDSVMKDVVNKDNLIVSSIVGTTPVKQVVKGVTFDATGKVATVEVYVPFAKGTEYSISYNEYKAGFVGADVSADAVASIVIDTTTAEVNTEKEIAVKLYNADGVEIALDAATLSARVTFTAEESIDYFMYDNKITFIEKGKVANVTAEYHTYKYNEDGTETSIKAVGAIVSVDKADVTVSSVNTATLVGVDATTTDWTKEAVTKLSVSDVDTAAKKLVVKSKNSANKDVTSFDEGNLFTFESSDINTLIVDEYTGALYPIKTGSATIIVKYDKTIVAAITITVLPARAVASVAVSMSANALSLTPAAADSITATITVKDQFGADLKNQTVTVDPLGHTVGCTVSDYKVTFNGTAGYEAGKTYQYKITVGGKVSRVVSFTTAAPTTTATYRVSVAKEIDMALAYGKTDNKLAALSVSVVGYASNGYKTEVVTLVDKDVAVKGDFYCTIVNPKGTDVTPAGAALQLVTADATSGSSIVKKAAAGTYKVTVYKKGADKDVVVAMANTIVKDTQAKPTLTIDKVTTSVADDVTAANACFTFKIGDDKFSAVSVVATGTADKRFIKTAVVPVNYTLADGSVVTIEHTVTVNQTITLQ